jgi:ketosteroid isomerase-like protein
VTREELAGAVEKWLQAWNRHDLDEVVALFSETAVFETWAGLRIEGRENIRKAWAGGFGAGGFSFTREDMVIDEAGQTVVFPWIYEGPAKCFDGRIEKRRGIDLIRFKDGMIAEKITYSKTSLEVEGRRITLTSGERR